MVAACEDWSKVKKRSKFTLYPADQIEIVEKKFEDGEKIFLHIKNSYPGMFNTFLNAWKGKKHPSHYYS